MTTRLKTMLIAALTIATLAAAPAAAFAHGTW
jgi:hypothetical protein